MAVESFPCPSTSPENTLSRGMSPRISFSHDIGQYDVVPIEPHLPLSPASLSASASFNFDSHQNPQNSSSADELFSNGVLLPLQNLRSSTPPPPLPPPPTPPGDDPKTGEEQSKARKPYSSSSHSHTSSFWKFRRSRSCNCGSIYTGTLCPILLPRSKSTGSNSSSKRSLVSKEDNHQHSQHQNRNLGGGGKQKSLFSGYQKPPLNKSYGSNPGGGLRVSPVLNVPSGNLFGLGSIFSSNGREKSNKKKLVI